MKKTYWIYIYILIPFCLFARWVDLEENSSEIILSTKQIRLKGFKDAFNPSILKTEKGFLITFRCLGGWAERLDPSGDFLSYVGAVFLDEDFKPITKPKILNTRSNGNTVQSQSEDARIFSYKGRPCLIYNDNNEMNVTNSCDRRDMFIAEILLSEKDVSLSLPIKLVCEAKRHQYCQKNWVPFEWEGKVLLSYTIEPHEVLYSNFYNGICHVKCSTFAGINWDYGQLRGSSAAVLVDGEYFAFFHSSIRCFSPVSVDGNRYHYFMGAYTFSKDPPFQITKISPEPIIHKSFYKRSGELKRVVFPGGFVIEDDLLYLAYARDDKEIWMATFDFAKLKESLVPVEELVSVNKDEEEEKAIFRFLPKVRRNMQ